MKAPAGLHIRNTEIGGIGPWLWRKADHWAWEHPLSGYPAIRNLLMAHAPVRKVLVQAGGCMGMYPRLFSEIFETVYTFEPDPVNFYCLTANCADARIVKMQAALSSQAGLGTFTPGPDFNAGMGTIGIPAAGHGSTLLLRLDDLRLARVDAIQLDCEGHEDDVLSGAMDTINRCRPLVIMEKPSEAAIERLAFFRYKEVGRTSGPICDVAFSAT